MLEQTLSSESNDAVCLSANQLRDAELPARQEVHILQVAGDRVKNTSENVSDRNT